MMSDRRVMILPTNDTHRATTIAGRKEVLDPSETIRVGAGSGRAGLVAQGTLGLNVLLPKRGAVLRRHVGLARLIRPEGARQDALERQLRKDLHALVHAKNDVGVAFHDNLLKVSDLVRSPKLRHKLDVGELVARVRRVGAPRVGPTPDG